MVLLVPVNVYRAGQVVFKDHLACDLPVVESVGPVLQWVIGLTVKARAYGKESF